MLGQHKMFQHSQLRNRWKIRACKGRSGTRPSRRRAATPGTWRPGFRGWGCRSELEGQANSGSLSLEVLKQGWVNHHRAGMAQLIPSWKG